MVEVGALVLLLGLAGLLATVALGAILSALLWIILLPVRAVVWLVGGILFLPLLLLKYVLGGLLLIVGLPLLVLVLGAAAVGLAAALFVPLTLVAAVIWYLVKPGPQAVTRV